MLLSGVTILKSSSQYNWWKREQTNKMKSGDQDCCFSQCGPGLSRLWPFQGDPCQVLKFESDPKILVVDQSDKANQENQADKKQLEEKSNILKVREKSGSELYKEASGVISLIKVSFE